MKAGRIALEGRRRGCDERQRRISGNGGQEGRTGTFTVKAGLAQMLKGGVIMDVVTRSKLASPRRQGRAR